MESAHALAILEDPARSFLTSDFLRMEVLPKAIYYQRPAEVALYERYFAKAQCIPVSEALVAQAYTYCMSRRNFFDGKHLQVR